MAEFGFVDKRTPEEKIIFSDALMKTYRFFCCLDLTAGQLNISAARSAGLAEYLLALEEAGKVSLSIP